MEVNREIIYEIFTVYGWVQVSFDGYRNHSGKKRRRRHDRGGKFEKEKGWDK